MRRLLGFAAVLACAACGLTEIKLENFPRPFACDRNGGDGGQQCVNGWVCGSDDRCFDPADRDGGTSRECTRDRECPTGFRCGQKVEFVQRCIELGVGAASACNDDQGCEGGFRCDLVAHQCVEVTDVLSTGGVSSFGARELNPRLHEPAPVLFAMNRLSRLPLAFGGPNRDGIFMASLLEDGTLRVAFQFLEEQPRDGGGTELLHELRFALQSGPAAAVTDLALSSEGPVVRYSDGGTFRANIADGGWEPLGATDFLRQRDPLNEPGVTQLIRVRGSRVDLDDPDAGFTFSEPVQEVVATSRTLYAVSPTGLSSFDSLQGLRFLTPGVGSFLSSRGTAAGLVSVSGVSLLSFFADVALDGGFGVVRYSVTTGWMASPPFAGCPDGGRPLQLSFDEERNGEPGLFTRCGAAASSFPVHVVSRGPGQPTEFQSVIEDQVPFQSGLVPQRASPFVRAHAGANGRVWYADDPAASALLANHPLRPLFLDRQPDAMLSFRELGTQRVRLMAQSNTSLFLADSNGGLVSQLAVNDIVPLSVVPSDPLWIVTTGGVLIADGPKPRLLAAVPAGASLVAPAPAATLTLQLSGQARQVVVVASGDTLWTADVTDALTGPFAQAAVLQRALVPVPGVALRSLMLDRSSGTLAGYLTTSTQNLSFSTSDLLRWSLKPVPTPSTLNALPLKVWSEPDAGGARTGFSDGVVWSLPIMVPLTAPLGSPDGGPVAVSDFGRKCGDVFAASSEGLFHAVPADGGRPRWEPVTLPVALDRTEGLRLYETHDDVERLFVATQSGQVVEVTATCR